jgi:hypothetical protein
LEGLHLADRKINERVAALADSANQRASQSGIENPAARAWSCCRCGCNTRVIICQLIWYVSHRLSIVRVIGL